MTLRAVDLFAGWGGFTLGAQQAGLEVVWASNHWPLAVQTHELNHPNTLHECQDLRQADWTKLPTFDVLLASPACFAADTMITSVRGVVPISSIRVGDLVLTHRNRWRTVTATMSRRAATVQLGVTETTADHRYWARRDNSNTIPTWVPAGRLRHAFVATPVDVTPACTPAGAADLSLHVWKTIGSWLAEPCADLSPTRALDGTTKSWRRTQHPARTLRAVLDRPSPSHLSPRAPSDIYAGELSDILIRFLALHFHDGHTRTIPGWLLGLPAAIRLAVLDGYLAARGVHLPTGGHLTVATKALGVGLRLLACSLGFDAQLQRSAPAASRTRAATWILSIGGSPQQAAGSDGMRWSPVHLPPHPARADIEVFDLTVAEDHSFVADGFVVHNCQGHSTASQPRRRPYHDALRATAMAVIDCADICEPAAVVVENVPAFRRWRLFDWWCAGLRTLGYHLDVRVLTASRFGVPQRRERLFIVATRDGVHVRTLNESTTETPIGPYLLPAAPGAWKSVSSAPPSVQARIAKARLRHGTTFITQHTTGHAGVPLSEPLRTVTTAPAHWNLFEAADKHDVGRYRTLSSRELARAMGFPDHFVWPQTASVADVTKGLGNAVCPPVATALLTVVADAIT